MTLPTSTMRAVCCALAAVAGGVHAANMKETFQQIRRLQTQGGDTSPSREHHRHHDRLPTQPIHRSILSHKKRTVLRDRHAGGGKIKGASGSDGGIDLSLRLRVARDRRMEDESGESNENEEEDSSMETAESEIDDKHSQSHDEPEEPESALLSSPFWVKIHEEFGQSYINFVPASRRAASSVVFTYKPDSSRVLIEEDAVVEGDNAGVTDATDALEQDIDESIESAQITNSTTTAITNDATGDSTDSSEEESAGTPSESEKQTGDSTFSTEEEEYMIISGGYTDRDWKSFPVYAFPLTSSIRTLSGKWIDLSPYEMESGVTSWCNDDDGPAAREKLYSAAVFLDSDDNNSTKEDPWKHAAPCAPTGRMGHQSVIHDDKLYVFGGLIYDEEQAPGGYGKKETFRLEDVPFVYRLDLKEMFGARRQESNGGDRSMEAVTGWQRIIPRVKPFKTPNGMSSTSAAEVLLTFVNRGEMQGGLWSSESSGDNDKFVMYGGLRIAKLEYEGYGHNNPSKYVKGESTFGSSSQMHSHKIVELPLGDVWAYDLVLDCWEKITNNYGKGVDSPVKDRKDTEQSDSNNGPSDKDDDDWWADLGVDYSEFPRPRTAHAATVVGNKLIIHGGMGWNEHTNDWDGSTDWETLDDMWILDLTTREWTRRWLFPLLVRSYHSLVGWSVDQNMAGWGKEFENCTTWEGPVVAAFGGYTTGIDVFSGEEVAYVFDDLLVSYPPGPKTNYDEPPSPWLKAIMPEQRDGAPLISTRYEHSAVLSKEGVMTIWGGSFQDTSGIHGVWMVNIAGEGSSVNLSMAEADSIYDDYERTITALHTIVIMLMFMSISLTLLLGLTQRYQELVQQANEDAAVAAGLAFSAQDVGNDSPPVRRGNGLHPEIIDTIPRKIYSASDASGDQEQECCPICLLDYSEGDECRELPCGHFMHKACLDAWLASHPSCPTCRYSLRELVDDRPMMQLRTLRSRLTSNPALARFLGHDFAEGIEMRDFSGDGSRGAVIDLRYVSSLALAEEDTAPDARVGESPQLRGVMAEDPDPLTLTAMQELGSWRARRNQMRRDRRRPRLAALRQNVTRIHNQRRTRVPLADLDEA